MKNEIIYSLNTEDVQTVAHQVLERDLTQEEIERIKDTIAEKMNWFDAIEGAILEKIEEPVE